MGDLSSEDIDKITKSVYAKIAEAMLGERAQEEPGGCQEGQTYGCPNQNGFGCKIGTFVCTGTGFICAPKYAGFKVFR